jgi:hypothetical protein
MRHKRRQMIPGTIFVANHGFGDTRLVPQVARGIRKQLRHGMFPCQRFRENTWRIIDQTIPGQGGD